VRALGGSGRLELCHLFLFSRSSACRPPTPTARRSRITSRSTSWDARAPSGECHHIAIAYRDTPAYVEARARFDAYAQGELKAHLRRGLTSASRCPSRRASPCARSTASATSSTSSPGRWGSKTASCRTGTAGRLDQRRRARGLGRRRPGLAAAASTQPGARVIALVLLVGGTVAAALGIVRLASDAGSAQQRILARGTVAARDGPPAEAVAFEGSDEPATVWLNLGWLSNVRETLVAGTECELARPDGSRQRIRGNRRARRSPPTTTRRSARPRSGRAETLCRAATSRSAA
jgi:hypothetical protein